MAKLRFITDRSFGSTQARAGAVLEVPQFWAERCLADGSAVLAEDDASADTVEATPPAPKPKRGKAKG